MANENGTVWIVYNGEIYNFRDLRTELETVGHRFKTTSDTEVVLRLYLTFGIGFVNKLRGMFALAIWDERERTLVLARDRIGIKPLYYHVGQSHIAFASEMKALLVDPRTPVDIDLAAISDYLHLLSIPDPISILKGVRKLEPGHLLVVQGQRVDKRVYWEIPLPDRPREITLEQACHEFDERFGDAVRSHLVSDVPVGAFLSGGVDSSAVVAFMEPEVGPEIYTFSTTFRGTAAFDEGPYARSVATRFGTNHQEVDLGAEAADVLPLLAWHCDEPFAISSGLGIYFLSKLARANGVKVVLTGDGSDEVFGGYTWKHIDFPDLPRLVPEALHGMLRRAMAVGRRFAPAFSGWRQMESAIGVDERYLRAFTCFQNEDLVGLVEGDAWPQMEAAWRVNVSQSYFDATSGCEQLTRKLYTDMRSTLVSEMLTKVDRMTMAAGVEARVPFLDHELVEWAFALPARLKIQAKEGKFLVKRALEPRLSRDILYRAKHGFNVPVGCWLRTQLRPLVEDLLSEESIRKRGILRPAAVRDLADRHFAGQDDIGNRVFVLMMLELWWRQVLDRLSSIRSKAS